MESLCMGRDVVTQLQIAGGTVIEYNLIDHQ